MPTGTTDEMTNSKRAADDLQAAPQPTANPKPKVQAKRPAKAEASASRRKKAKPDAPEATTVTPRRKPPIKPADSSGESQSTVTPKEVEAASSPVVITLTHDQIAARARDIWLRKGRPIGLDDQNWRDAEAELKRERG